ncbi:DUF397 domain-containing protein [Streptomyces syringium]|uniref:DUF397 domain-containing protein n=1 Tax=Streptomyces syringium TaxID=76729 RepID=UPI003AAA62F3
MSNGLLWFKSSYSDDEGGACVEVALAWRKSSHSDDEGGECVEVAALPHTIHVRDSKLGSDGSAPELMLTPRTWTEFISHVAGA